MRIRMTMTAVLVAIAMIPPSANAQAAGMPTSRQILDLAGKTAFAKQAVTDRAVSAEIKAINTRFGIRVFFREEKRPYTPEAGVVIARLELQGIPSSYQIPDGTYYLWMGGPPEAARAFLANMDGSSPVEMQVLDKPSLPEQAKPHAPSIHGGVETVAAAPGPAVPPGVPPPPPPPRRSWREICYPYAPTDHGAPGGWRWTKVPDS